MSLTFTLELPPDIEEHLRAETDDLEAEIAQAAAIEYFRRDRLSHFQLSQVLGLDRFETDALLQRLGVEEHTLSIEEVRQDVETGLRFLRERDRCK